MAIGPSRRSSNVSGGEFLTGEMNFISTYSRLPLNASGVTESLEEFKARFFLDPSQTRTVVPDTPEVWKITLIGDANADGSIAPSRIKIDGKPYSTYAGSKVEFANKASADTVATKLAAAISQFPQVDSATNNSGNIVVTFTKDRPHSIDVTPSSAYGFIMSSVVTTAYVEGQDTFTYAASISQIPEEARTINGVTYLSDDQYAKAYWGQWNFNTLISSIETLAAPVILTNPKTYTGNPVAEIAYSDGDTDVTLFKAAGQKEVYGFVFATEHVGAFGSYEPVATGPIIEYELTFDTLIDRLSGLRLFNTEGDKIALTAGDFGTNGMMQMLITDEMLSPGLKQ